MQNIPALHKLKKLNKQHHRESVHCGQTEQGFACACIFLAIYNAVYFLNSF